MKDHERLEHLLRAGYPCISMMTQEEKEMIDEKVVKELRLEERWPELEKALVGLEEFMMDEEELTREELDKSAVHLDVIGHYLLDLAKLCRSGNPNAIRAQLIQLVEKVEEDRDEEW